MVCELSHSTTKGLSISSLVVAAVALVLGVLAVMAHKQGHRPSKSVMWLGILFYLGAFALILSSGLALYGRSVARCARRKQKKDKKHTKLSALESGSGGSGDDDGKDNESTSHVIFTCLALALFFVLIIMLCASSPGMCFFLWFLNF